MKNSFSVFISDITDVQIQEIEKTDRHHQISVDTFRVEHTFCKAFQNCSYNLCKPEAPRLHGGTNGFLLSEEHYIKQPVFKDNTP